MGDSPAAHLRALRDHGPSPIPRRSFAPVRAALGLPAEPELPFAADAESL
jgi:hypothetical protein